MKFSSLLFYPILSLTCIGAEVLTDVPLHSPQRTLKRSLSENSRELRDKTDTKKARPQEFLDQEKLNKLLDVRAELLMHEVSKAVESLRGIREELKRHVQEAKVEAQKDNNYKNVSELAGLVVSTISLDKSANLILKNLAPLRGSKEGDVVSNASVAIIASCALENDLNQFLRATEKYPEAKGIHYETLRVAHDKMKEITNDIAIKNKFVTLEEDR